MLWLWRRPAAVAPIRPLAWEPPYATGMTLKRQNKKKKKKKKRKGSWEEKEEEKNPDPEFSLRRGLDQRGSGQHAIIW